MHRPLRASQMLTVLSEEAVSKELLYGCQATSLTESTWPLHSEWLSALSCCTAAGCLVQEAHTAPAHMKIVSKELQHGHAPTLHGHCTANGAIWLLCWQAQPSAMSAGQQGTTVGCQGISGTAHF